MMRIARRARRALVRLRTSEFVTQNLWFLAGIPPSRVGYGSGWLTAWRLRRHRRRRRAIHIALLEYHTSKPRFGALTAFWINERSRLCSATLNSGIEEADVLWVYTQDPLTAEARERLRAAIDQAKPGARIVNHPDRYNAYHVDRCFQDLDAAGVSVPDTRFSDSDRGRVRVVYKRRGLQAAQKTVEDYTGPRDGYQAFRFIDTRGPDGLYRRYRAFYLVGIVRPSKLMLCEHWNVCLKHRPRLQFGFTMTPEEIRQVRSIARTLGLEYFAVDYLRRHGDDRPFFTDVNVYPTVLSVPTTGRELGYHGRWHTFDTRARLGLPEPGGRPFEEIFDAGMMHFVENRPFPSDPDALND